MKLNRKTFILSIIIIIFTFSSCFMMTGCKDKKAQQETTPQETTEAVETRSEAPAGPNVTILFASDYQQLNGWPAPKENLTNIIHAAKDDEKTIDKMIICGDYTNVKNRDNYQISPDESIAEIEAIANEEGIMEDNVLFVQGNHDRMSDNLDKTGLYEYDDYLVYILGTETDFPWRQGHASGALKKVKAASKAMNDCFLKLVAKGESRPVIIAGHVPLHFSARTSSKHDTGDNLYSSLIFDVVNQYAQDLDIVYLVGHNHSKGWDCYLGGSCIFKAKGDTILIPEFKSSDVCTDTFREETIKFTYLNAGYLGYYMNCGRKELEKGKVDQYHAADETLTGTICEIYPDKIVLTRYDADGVHDLGSPGVPNPYKNYVDKGLISEDYYSHEVTSPQTIKRNQKASE